MAKRSTRTGDNRMGTATQQTPAHLTSAWTPLGQLSYKHGKLHGMGNVLDQKNMRQTLYTAEQNWSSVAKTDKAWEPSGVLNIACRSLANICVTGTITFLDS